MPSIPVETMHTCYLYLFVQYCSACWEVCTGNHCCVLVITLSPSLNWENIVESLYENYCLLVSVTYKVISVMLFFFDYFNTAGLTNGRLSGVQKSVSIIRDAPIIGIGQLSAVLPIFGRLLCRYHPIVIYYVLWWHWMLKLFFFNLNGRHIFLFYN